MAYGYDNNRDQAGRSAMLTEEVSFNTSITLSMENKRKFPAGTIVTLKFYQGISDLYIFNFRNKQGNWDFPIRDTKFIWLDQ
jgi:hypothetical protein